MSFAGGAGSQGAAPLQDPDKHIVHVLNRIGFGPRPGDVERVRATGVQQYIDQNNPTPAPLSEPGA